MFNDLPVSDHILPNHTQSTRPQVCSCQEFNVLSLESLSTHEEVNCIPTGQGYRRSDTFIPFSFISCLKVTLIYSPSEFRKDPIRISRCVRDPVSSTRIWFFAIVSLFWTSCTCFSSSRVRGRSISRSLTVFHIDSSVIFRHCNSSNYNSSFHIVRRLFSPVITDESPFRLI